MPSLGTEIVSILQEDGPLVGALLGKGIGDAELLSLEIDRSDTKMPFNARSNSPPTNLPIPKVRSLRALETLKSVLVEEMESHGEGITSRVRLDPKKGELVIDRLKMPVFPGSAHILLLDATADERITEHLFGPIQFDRVDIEQNAFVTQVYDRTGSNMSWTTDEERIDDLILVLKDRVRSGETVLCVAHKALADELRNAGLPEEIRIAHFGNLRGSDDYKDCDTIVVTGRNQPPQSDVDGLARAVWWNDPQPLQHDPASLLNAPPETDLPCQLRGYWMADPSERWGVRVRSFSDARIEAIHGQIREAETVQALARLRLVHSPKRKAVFLLGNLPVEMPVDRLVEWNQLMPDKAERALLEKGNIALSPTGILKTRPDLAATA